MGLLQINHSLHSCRMSWRLKIRNIVSYSMTTGVTFYSPQKLKISGKGMRSISRSLIPPRQRLLILTVTTLLGWRIRRRRGLVSYLTRNSMRKRRLRIMGRSTVVFFVRSQECLKESIRNIAPKTASERFLVRIPSMKYWGETKIIGIIPSTIIKNLKRHVKGNWNPLRIRTICY